MSSRTTKRPAPKAAGGQKTAVNKTVRAKKDKRAAEDLRWLKAHTFIVAKEILQREGLPAPGQIGRQEERIVFGDSMKASTFVAYAKRRRWPLAKEIPSDDEVPVAELVFRCGENTVHYIEDGLVKVRYAVVLGPDFLEIGKEIRADLDCLDDEWIFKSAAANTDNLQFIVDWILPAAVLREQLGRERLIILLLKRLEHPHSAVRRATLLSVSWLEWPEFREAVERLARKDPALDAREDASRLAEAYAMRDRGEL